MTKNNYKFNIIYLQNCPYSEAALHKLTTYKIEKDVEIVSSLEKEKYKTKYNFQTFPHITFKKNNKLICTIGGNDNLTELIETVFNKSLTNDMIMQYMTKYKTSKRNILRLVENINIMTKKKLI